MRLKKEQIQKIASLLTTELQKQKAASFKVSEEKIRERIQEIITQNMMEEVKLEDDVRKLMEQYRAQINSGQLDSQKVFQMIKKQLVKERNLVI